MFGFILQKRYLKCPSGVTIRILKRFIRMKYGIQEDWRVEIFYNGESMNDNFSLADMIYTFGNEEVRQLSDLINNFFTIYSNLLKYNAALREVTTCPCILHAIDKDFKL